jgi:hypothetical protein
MLCAHGNNTCEGELCARFKKNLALQLSESLRGLLHLLLGQGSQVKPAGGQLLCGADTSASFASVEDRQSLYLCLGYHCER